MQTALLKRGSTMLGVLCGVFAGFGLMCHAAAAPLYSLDITKRTITIHNTGDVSAQVNSALSYLTTRTDKSNLWTMKFDGGKYVLSRMLFSEGLQNVSFVSDPAKPAILTKGNPTLTEYLFYTRFSKNITMTGFTLIGSTPAYIPNNYLTGSSIGWQDQGIYFGSCNGVTISNNRFLNIGNGAIRVTTTEKDPVKGVNSFNTQISNNYFDNIFQISTTSNDLVHGGSANMLVQDNIFDHIWGSVKFASRTEGATNVVYRRNKINNSATDGMEIVGYVNMEISDNTFQNIARNAVNSYTNSVCTKGFEWGDNITFKNNIINNTGGGIRMSADPYVDGFKPQLKNVTLNGNKITNLKGTAPALTLQKSTFPGLVVTNNQFSNIPSKNYVYLPLKNLSAIVTGNRVDSTLLKIF